MVHGRFTCKDKATSARQACIALQLQHCSITLKRTTTEERHLSWWRAEALQPLVEPHLGLPKQGPMIGFVALLPNPCCYPAAMLACCLALLAPFTCTSQLPHDNATALQRPAPPNSKTAWAQRSNTECLAWHSIPDQLLAEMRLDVRLQVPHAIESLLRGLVVQVGLPGEVLGAEG